MTQFDFDNHYASLYNQEAATYDRKRFTSHKGRFDRDFKNAVIVDILRRRGLLSPQTTLADMAAGTGRITHVLVQESAARIIAIDISEKMLAENERHLRATDRGQVDYRVMSMKAMDLPDGCVDAAILGSFLYLIPQSEYPAYTEDIYRILKPGGFLIAEIANALILANPKNFLRCVIHRHVQKKLVTSHVYPWEVPALFGSFRVAGAIGTTFPVFAKKYGTYARYSTLLGRTPWLKYLGGKCTLVLQKP